MLPSNFVQELNILNILVTLETFQFDILPLKYAQPLKQFDKFVTTFDNI